MTIPCVPTLVAGIEIRWFAEAGYQILDFQGYPALKYFAVNLRRADGTEIRVHADGPTLDAMWAVLGRFRLEGEPDPSGPNTQHPTPNTSDFGSGPREWETGDKLAWVCFGGETYDAFVTRRNPTLDPKTFTEHLGDFSNLETAISIATQAYASANPTMTTEEAAKLVEQDDRGFSAGQEG